MTHFNERKSGKLDIIIGPMFSKKSSELVDRLVLFSELGLNVLYINHSFDVRSTSTILSTHNPIIDLKKLSDIKNLQIESLSTLKGVRRENFDVIGIDEAQFFDDSLIDFVQVHVETYKKHLIVCGLNSTSTREKFGHILDLIPLCDTITNKRAYCHICGPSQKKALFSHKISKDTDKISIGGKDKYIALCRNCYLEKNQEI